MSDNFNQLTSNILSPKEIRRYQLQMDVPGIGLAGQEKIKQASVLVIGAGGKGTSVLQNLATIGVGKIGISDNFPVQENELSRQHLYGNGDLGKQKAIVTKQKLVEINHLVSYELHNVCLSESNIDRICKDYDILIDATNNFSSRYLINDAAIRLNKPWIFGRLIGSSGLVSVFNYKDGPSMRCLFPKEPSKADEISQSGFACQVSLLSIIGAIIANETVKVVLQHETELNGKLLKYNAQDYSFAFENITKNPENFF